MNHLLNATSVPYPETATELEVQSSYLYQARKETASIQTDLQQQTRQGEKSSSIWDV